MYHYVLSICLNIKQSLSNFEIKTIQLISNICWVSVTHQNAIQMYCGWHEDIRNQTSMSVASGQRAPALSHTAAQQKGLYSDRPHGKKNTLWYWRWGEYSISVSSPDNGVIVSFLLMVSHFLNGLFFPLFLGCHVAFWATYGTTLNIPFMEAPGWINQLGCGW